MSPSPAQDGEQRWMSALLALARELWVVRDRQLALEALLAEKGVVLGDEVDRWQPDEARQAALDAECRALVQKLASECLPSEADR